MTALAMAGDRERCTAAGMDDFVSKPVTLAAVEAALTRWAHVSDDHTPPPTSTPTDSERSSHDDGVLDLGRIGQLRQLGSMGGTDLLGRVVALFAQDGEHGLAAIREATVEHSVAGQQQALHKLRGTAANIGANRVAALCRQLEEQAVADGGGRGATATLVTSQQLDELETELACANRAIARTV
jgi:HPt (histidine-containing phosphotransfer) domain-containing protein